MIIFVLNVLLPVLHHSVLVIHHFLAVPREVALYGKFRLGSVDWLEAAVFRALHAVRVLNEESAFYCTGNG